MVVNKDKSLIDLSLTRVKLQAGARDCCQGRRIRCHEPLSFFSVDHLSFPVHTFDTSLVCRAHWKTTQALPRTSYTAHIRFKDRSNE